MGLSVRELRRRAKTGRAFWQGRYKIRLECAACLPSVPGKISSKKRLLNRAVALFVICIYAPKYVQENDTHDLLLTSRVQS